MSALKKYPTTQQVQIDKARAEYEEQCRKTAERAAEAMANCIKNGSFDHYKEWEAANAHLIPDRTDLH